MVFVVTWAAAVLFHLAGNPTLAPAWARAILGGTAIVALVWPRRAWAVVPLAGAVVMGVWLEAPFLANHWLLHGLVALVVLGGVVAARGDAVAAVARVAGPARLTLLAF